MTISISSFPQRDVNNTSKMTGCLRPGKVVIATTGVEKGRRSWLMGVLGKLDWSLEENITEDGELLKIIIIIIIIVVNLFLLIII